MSTTKDFKNYILEQLELLEDITCRPMMGEFLLYYKGCLFGGIYDGRLLIKPTDNNKKFNLVEAIPYAGAKPMLMIENVDNKERNKEIITLTCKDLLKNKKNKKNK